MFRRTMAGLREAGHVTSGKGHGGGWQLARAIAEITLREVCEALGRPALFAIGARSRDADCLIEKGVNAALSETMNRAEALVLQRFSELTLAQLMPADLKAPTAPA